MVFNISHLHSAHLIHVLKIFESLLLQVVFIAILLVGLRLALDVIVIEQILIILHFLILLHNLLVVMHDAMLLQIFILQLFPGGIVVNFAGIMLSDSFGLGLLRGAVVSSIV